jgi:hypothetical protein
MWKTYLVIKMKNVKSRRINNLKCGKLAITMFRNLFRGAFGNVTLQTIWAFEKVATGEEV